MSKKILVVDDDPTTNTLVHFLLKSKGYSPISAKDGDEGLEKVKEDKPELIILDVGMPKVDGFTFLGELKALMGNEMPKIIMLTGKTETKELFSMEPSVVDFFTKPLDSERFCQRVAECLGG